MKKYTPLFNLLVLAALLLTACGQKASPTSTNAPAQVPTKEPTVAPTVAPTAVPTEAPTKAPEPTATPVPTKAPEPTATQPPAPTDTPQPTVAPTAEVVAVAKTLRLPDLGGKTVRAVTENAYTPLNFVDPLTGKAVGWEYDAVNEICRRLNCTIDWQITSWDTMIAAVKEGQFDVGMDGITITDERKKEVDFSIPYMTSQQFMLVRADETRFSTPAEFAADTKLLIGSQAGTTNFYAAVYKVLDGDEANPRIKLFENFGAAVQALISGDVDLVLLDAASGRGYIGANPEKLKIIGGPITSEDFGFIFTPGSDLVAAFDAAIQTMKDDGYLAYLNTRWFFLYDPTAK
jgi:ABC-type amino acid transport substrate-binding protein